MHAAAYCTLRTAQRSISRRACRTIAGTRHSLPRRNFHRSAISCRIPDTPPPAENDRHKEPPENQEDEVNGRETKHEVTPVKACRDDSSPRDALDSDSPNVQLEDTKSIQSQEQAGNKRNVAESTEDANQPVENLTLSQRRQSRYARYGSRSNRSKTTEGLPPVVIPEWFYKKNVICAGDDVSDGSLAVYSGESPGSNNGENPINPEDVTGWELPSAPTTKYKINVNVYREIVSATQSGLLLRPPRNIPLTNIPRPVLHLQCPKEDGALYLDSVVEATSRRLNADLIRLDADDLAQIVGPYVDENLAWTWTKYALLGFDTQKMAGKLEDPARDLDAAGPAENDNPIANAVSRALASLSGRPRRKPSSAAGSIPQVGFTFPLASLISATRSPNSNSSSESMPNYGVYASGDSSSQQPLHSSSEQWLDLKVSAALDALIGAADSKRAMSPSEGNESSAQDQAAPARRVIVQVKDFMLLNNVLPDGRAVLKKLHDAINKRWFAGRDLIMLGTTSKDDIETPVSKLEIQILQSDVIDGETRTIFVPPSRKQEQDVVFVSDEKARIRRINIRHVEEMVSKLGGGTLDQALTINIETGIDTATAFSSDLEDQVWSYPRVHRLATTIIGLNPSITRIDGTTFTQARRLLEASDGAKFAWAEAELEEEDEDAVEAVLQASKNSAETFKKKIKKIRSEATPHEKKLLGGVISPADISTTFSDVHASKVTVEALKALTSLSLIRPEAFSYGVLATDKIPGLLLYGPPGTGKTLLAKAVAKESGATVLEVSGAEVTDMYVGEGEKNVKAIFSLAKKLSPCIVFIDEADSLLGSRGGESSKRTTHREIINQFLREWDGLSDLSAFIMVATNRPFDLDDAVLRRLPRRLLVDLPLEKDRQAILQIHLKDEVLDESVSLASIAKDTPFYSGSDLKNVAVSAAMSCIREENDAASKHTGNEPYLYPPKRLLMKHHFTKALDEISASISEDMGTLSAIRKFDEKYGDRRGRRKKAAAMGFGGTTIPEKDSEAARVRKIEA